MPCPKTSAASEQNLIITFTIEEGKEHHHLFDCPNQAWRHLTASCLTALFGSSKAFDIACKTL